MIFYIIGYFALLEALFYIIKKESIWKALKNDYIFWNNLRVKSDQGFGVIDFILNTVKYLFTPLYLVTTLLIPGF